MATAACVYKSGGGEEREKFTFFFQSCSRGCGSKPPHQTLSDWMLWSKSVCVCARITVYSVDENLFETETFCLMQKGRPNSVQVREWCVYFYMYENVACHNKAH